MGRLTSSLSPLQSYYAARAGEYDSVYRKPERQADLRDIERWLPTRLAGARLLELACGTGYWTRFIAPAASSILAIDSAPETLRIAAKRAAAANVAFEVGDAYAPPSSPRPFDAAFAGFWFSHVPLQRQREFLAGLNAVLEPGAKVVLLDNLFVEGSSSPITEHDDAGNTYQSRKLDDGSTHRVLKNFPTEAQLLALMASGLGRSAEYVQWRFYWALVYRVPGP
jgi:ubiquinone/menaquinone biosynthesis C-methylase UbiE